jgi:hypothetical protein
MGPAGAAFAGALVASLTGERFTATGPADGGIVVAAWATWGVLHRLECERRTGQVLH